MFANPCEWTWLILGFVRLFARSYCGPGRFSLSPLETKLTGCSTKTSAQYGSDCKPLRMDMVDIWVCPPLCSVFYCGPRRFSLSSLETKLTGCSTETSARYRSARQPLRLDMIDLGICPLLYSVFYRGPGRFSSFSLETKLTGCSTETSA